MAKKSKSYLSVTMTTSDQVKEKQAKDTLQKIIEAGAAALGAEYQVVTKGEPVTILDIKVKYGNV